MPRTPWHSLAQNTRDRRVFWLRYSCCTARAWSSFLPLLQEVSSMCKTRNQLLGKEEEDDEGPVLRCHCGDCFPDAYRLCPDRAIPVSPGPRPPVTRGVGSVVHAPQNHPWEQSGWPRAPGELYPGRRRKARLGTGSRRGLLAHCRGQILYKISRHSQRGRALCHRLQNRGERVQSISPRWDLQWDNIFHTLITEYTPPSSTRPLSNAVQ